MRKQICFNILYTFTAAIIENEIILFYICYVHQLSVLKAVWHGSSLCILALILSLFIALLRIVQMNALMHVIWKLSVHSLFILSLCLRGSTIIKSCFHYCRLIRTVCYFVSFVEHILWWRHTVVASFTWSNK